MTYDEKKPTTYEILQDLLLRYPDLTSNGFNTGYSMRLHCKDLDKALENFEHYQKQLLRDVDEFDVCIQYLNNPNNVKQSIGSYKLKHQIERECHRYISNGTLIAAALYLGRINLRKLGKDHDDPNATIQPQSPLLGLLQLQTSFYLFRLSHLMGRAFSC